MTQINRMLISLAVLFGLTGCPSFNQRPPIDIIEPVGPSPSAAQSGIDPRAVSADLVELEAAPPPISGGTLLAVSDGTLLVADPDRDRLVFVDATRDIFRTHNLRAGDEPGRAIETASQKLLVVLRGTGELLDVEADSRVHVCDSPRGIAATESNVWVACRDGNLLALDAHGHTIERTLAVAKDLRDVVAIRDRLFVSTFRDARVLEVSAATGSILHEYEIADTRAMAPSVAYRMIGVDHAGAIQLTVSHQLASQQTIATHMQPSSSGESSYGGGSVGFEPTCEGIVQTGVTVIDVPNDMPGVTTAPVVRTSAVAQATLPVDLVSLPSSQSPTLGSYALVAAGNQANLAGVKVIGAWELNAGGCSVGNALPVDETGNTIAVARLVNGDLAVQTREPSSIRIYRARPNTGEEMTLVRTVSLGGASRFDTGHALFHGAASGTIACASCHAEGGDDGRTWRFTEGARRTPTMFAGITTTAPFHWSGDQANFARLMDDVFVRRMGGPRLSTERANVLESWVDRMPEPARTVAQSSASIRGQAIFAGAGQCASCHTGAHFTNNQTVDVGTGGAFQVPPLVGLRDHLPLMHNGCATTLSERFDVRCGGTRHGNTNLTSAQQSDVVAYLETL